MRKLRVELGIFLSAIEYIRSTSQFQADCRLQTSQSRFTKGFCCKAFINASLHHTIYYYPCSCCMRGVMQCVAMHNHALIKDRGYFIHAIKRFRWGHVFENSILNEVLTNSNLFLVLWKFGLSVLQRDDGPADGYIWHRERYCPGGD